MKDEDNNNNNNIKSNTFQSKTSHPNLINNDPSFEEEEESNNNQFKSNTLPKTGKNLTRPMNYSIEFIPPKKKKNKAMPTPTFGNNLDHDSTETESDNKKNCRFN